MYTDDAYNKARGADTTQGTLIGNWFEERSLREAVGEGRTVPQRHIKRSGLLQDFTKVPTGGTRKMDDTFERCIGQKEKHTSHMPSSTEIGRHDLETVNHVGPRERTQRTDWHAVAEDEVQMEEDFAARKHQERSFVTTTGTTFAKPDESQAERAQHLSKSCKAELMHGPTPDRALGLANEGLDFPSHAHYSNVEGVTHARMALADPVARNDMRVSACGGVRAFGRNSEFSKPISEFTRGLAKDEELENMYQGLKGTQPLRTLSGGQPHGGAFTGVPSLAALKSSIHAKIAEVWGAHGYVVLRQRLFDHGDHEGYIAKANAVTVIRNDLGLSEDEVSQPMLDTYLGQLVTMKKSELKIGSFLSSLRPALLQKDKRRIMEAYKSMEACGACRLGDWLGRLQDAELRSTIVAAFGAQDEDMVADMPLTEQVFLEVLSDLAPFKDIDALLP